MYQGAPADGLSLHRPGVACTRLGLQLDRLASIRLQRRSAESAYANLCPLARNACDTPF